MKIKQIVRKQGVAEGVFGDIKQSFATGMADKLKKAIPAEHHKHYDFDSVKSPSDTKAIVARAKAAGHLKEQGVSEDDTFGKIANIDAANKKVTIEKPDGTKLDVPNNAVMPDPTKPGSATIDASATTGDLKPGEVVNTAAPTSETQGDEVDEATGWGSMDPQAANAMMSVYNELAPHITKHEDSEGAARLFEKLKELAREYKVAPAFKSLIISAQQGAHQDYDTNPGDFKNWFWYVGDMLKHVAKSDEEEGGIEVGEEHDTIAHGGGDVGGDATDSFNQEIVGDFDRAQRGDRNQGTRSPLSENDELMKWLTIAGIK